MSTNFGQIWYWNQLKQRSKKLSQKEKEKSQKDFDDWVKKRKELESKSRRKNTIRNNINEKRLNYSVTFTLASFKHILDEKKIKRSLTQLLRRYNIPYILVPEYHESGVIHFHGFVRINDLSMIQRKIIKGVPITDRFNNKVYELIVLEKNYGFTTLKEFENKPEWEKHRMINYLLKYITKNNGKLMSSRYGCYNSYTFAVEMFGIKKVKQIDEH